MNTTKMRRLAIQATLAASVCGTTFQIAGCLSQVGQNFNPCGTVLNCDPTEWDAMFLDVPDFNYNPTCTIPTLFNCETPISGATGANADPGTGTTGTTTTGTTRGNNNNNTGIGLGT